MEKKGFDFKKALKDNIVPICAVALSAVIFVFSVINHGRLGGLMNRDSDLASRMDLYYSSLVNNMDSHSANAAGRFDNLDGELSGMKGETSSLLSQLDTTLAGILNELSEIRKDLNDPLGGQEDYGAVLDTISGNVENLGRKIDGLSSKLDSISAKLDAINNRMDDLSRPVVISDTPVPLAMAYTPEVTEGYANVGDTVVVRIFAQNVQDMYGYQYNLNYDKKELTYTKKLTSKVEGLDMIFAKDFDTYVLVGSTKVGPLPGFTGSNLSVCEVSFTANKAMDLTELSISLEKVNIVDSKLVYTEGVTNWSCSAVVGR